MNMTTRSAEIKAVIFDLGRVLVDVDFSLFLNGLYENVQDEADLKDFSQVTHCPLWQRYNRGELSPVQFYAAFCSEYKISIAYDVFADLWCSIFSAKADMLALAEELQRRIPVGLLSDTDPLHWLHVQASYPIIAGISRPTLSYQVGALKPHPRIYEAAAANVGAAMGHCFFIDDLAVNVQGALDAGMQAVELESAGQIRGLLEEAGIL